MDTTSECTRIIKQKRQRIKKRKLKKLKIFLTDVKNISVTRDIRRIFQNIEI